MSEWPQKPESIKFLKEYCDFSDPKWVWILTGISRAKDNAEGYHDILKRFVLTKPSDIVECYDRIHQETTVKGTIYRMYISLNARDAAKCAFKFGQRIFTVCEGLSSGHNDALVIAKKLGSEWKSELAQSHCRATKRILLDVDAPRVEDFTEVIKFVGAMPNVRLHTTRRTRGGWHVVFDACDTRKLMDDCKNAWIPVALQRDSMVFVESWETQ